MIYLRVYKIDKEAVRPAELAVKSRGRSRPSLSSLGLGWRIGLRWRGRRRRSSLSTSHDQDHDEQDGRDHRDGADQSDDEESLSRGTGEHELGLDIRGHCGIVHNRLPAL